MFLGEQLEDVIDQLIDKGDATSSIQKGKLKTGASTLPDLNKDATDRNRTSPFAFTGNKFEFRMLGSSDSVAPANVVLNTIVAESFKEIADELDGAENFDMAVHDLIKKLFTEHKRIVFNGNGYSDEWVEEAARRGLPNITSMVAAIPALVTDESVKLFESFGVYTKAELESRVEIQYEGYSKAINIEAKSMIDIASKQIIPAVISYTTELAGSIAAVKEVGADASVQADMLGEISGYLKDMKAALNALIKVTDEAAAITGAAEQAKAYRDSVRPAMDALRAPADKLEMLVDKEYWPFPSYGDLLFEV
jgi:glutamine synthetase